MPPSLKTFSFYLDESAPRSVKEILDCNGYSERRDSFRWRAAGTPTRPC